VEIARLGDTTELAVARAILERLSDRRGLAAADALKVSLSRSSPPAQARRGSLTGPLPLSHSSLVGSRRLRKKAW